jgi:hypothetical protein
MPTLATAYVALREDQRAARVDPPAAVYADGGVILQNPSPHGGTWAWCWTDAPLPLEGTITRQDSGLLVPAADGELVTNNQTEFFAVMAALRSLPDGWSGMVYTDSQVTLRRVRDPEGARMEGIPPGWVACLKRHRGRLGELHLVLLDGHPTRAHLDAGTGKRGGPVSPHNVHCDKACGRVGAWYRKEYGV